MKHSPRRRRPWMGMMMKAVEATSVPMALVVDDKIVQGNDAFNALCGATVPDRNPKSLFDEKGAELYERSAESAREESDKIVLRTASGEEVLAQIWPIDGNFYLLSLKHNFSAHRLADIDELTRLPNRRKTELLLEIEVSRIPRSGGFCLALGDIDYFKRVNDEHGHDIGDKVLCHVTKIIKDGLRDGDWVARWGGEEFLIFLAGENLITGYQAVERVRGLLESTPYPGPPRLDITMSFGITSSETGDDSDTIISEADALLYRAKDAGRNCIISSQGNSTTWLMGTINEAIEKEQIEPVYLPIRDWEGRVAAVHVTHGLAGDEHDEQVKAMLAAAQRLRMRNKVDIFLMEKLNDTLATADGDYPVFFPVTDDMVGKESEALLDSFRKYPRLHAGLYSDQPLSAENMQTLRAANVPMALLDFSVKSAPLGLLAEGMVKHLVYAHPDDASTQAVLSLLPKITCYVNPPASPNRETQERWRALGFVGMVEAVGGAPSGPRWRKMPPFSQEK